MLAVRFIVLVYTLSWQKSSLLYTRGDIIKTQDGVVCLVKANKNTNGTIRRRTMGEISVRYAVTLFRGDEERILAVFDTKAEADQYGRSNLVPTECGIQACCSGMFIGNIPYGNSMNIYHYYNR